MTAEPRADPTDDAVGAERREPGRGRRGPPPQRASVVRAPGRPRLSDPGRPHSWSDPPTTTALPAQARSAAETEGAWLRGMIGPDHDHLSRSLPGLVRAAHLVAI